MADDITSEINAYLQAWRDRYRAKDADALIAMAVDEEVQIVGTGADEVRFGPAEFRTQAERDFAQADDVDMSFDGVRVCSAGDAAFAYCDVTVTGTAGGEQFEMPGLRGTFGLVRTGDGWKLAQAHLSAPYGGQAEGSSF